MTLSRGTIVAAALMALVSCFVKADTQQVELEQNGALRQYLVHLAPSRSKAPMPVVVALHGGGGNAEQMERSSQLSRKADTAGFIAVYPDGSGRFGRMHTWNAGACCAWAMEHDVDDAGFIIAVIDDVVRRFGGDPKRVYLTGMSNGAMMAYRVAAEHPEKIAAIAAVSGTLEVDPKSIRGPVPVLHFHGTADEHVPFEGGHGSKSLVDVRFRSVSDTVGAWIGVNHAAVQPVIERMPDRTDDGMYVTRETHPAPGTGADVVLYVIHGGGHAWPGSTRSVRKAGEATRDIDADDVMWEFFSRHVK